MPRQLVALLLLLLLERGAPFTRSAPRFTGGRPWCAVVSSSAADGASIDFADSSSIREGGSIYSAPELYDLAFSYRDFEAEVAFLLEAHARHSGKGARTATAGGGGRGGGGSSGGSSGDGEPGNGDKSRRGGENSSDRDIGNTGRRQVGHVGRVRELVRALERGIGSGGSAGASSTHSKGPGRSGTTSGR